VALDTRRQWLQRRHRRSTRRSKPGVPHGDPLRHYCQHAADRFTGSADDHAFAQWLAQQGWAQVHATLRDEGASIGIADLAWAARRRASRHAPGLDLLQGRAGRRRRCVQSARPGLGHHQLVTDGVAARGASPYLRVLRAVMAGRGGLRIDHILGLLRLWAPRGAGAGRACTCAIRSMI
jgi:4-alpha-glucanotransferase